RRARRPDRRPARRSTHHDALPPGRAHKNLDRHPSYRELHGIADERTVLVRSAFPGLVCCSASPHGVDPKSAPPCHRGLCIWLKPRVRAGGEWQPLPVLSTGAPEWKPSGEQVSKILG